MSKREIVRDEFTKRLLLIHLAIVKRGEIRYKKEFTGALKIDASFYCQIENATANYPPDKQEIATASLFDKYGVNPGYLKGTADLQFVREARPIIKAVKEEAVMTNYSGKKVKQELAEKEAYIKELEAQLAANKLTSAAEPKVSYNPDKKSDKKKKK